MEGTIGGCAGGARLDRLGAAAKPALLPGVGVAEDCGGAEVRGGDPRNATDNSPAQGAVFTDGSVGLVGGAVAVRMDDETGRRAWVGLPRSSTHCELVGLSLAMGLEPTEIITDSLAALRLLKGWGRAEMPTNNMTEHPDRRLVRRLLEEAKAAGYRTLEKVKAHDEGAIDAGVPKAAGNAEADRQAKQAVKEQAGPEWQGEVAEFGDPMEL